MFCQQCEQTAKGVACDKIGVCGKQPEVSDLQDILVYALRGLGQAATAARAKGVSDPEIDAHAAKALFATLTNVNFDPEAIAGFIKRTVELRKKLAGRVGFAAHAGPAAFEPAASAAGLAAQASVAALPALPAKDADCRSLQHTLLFGLKGLAAYADHAQILGQSDEAVYAFLHQALAALGDETRELAGWVELTLQCGSVNVRAMELLDAGNTGTYGHPIVTSVPLGHKKGKAILVSGHDLKDLETLLVQTEGKGINIYTHGEMLPTHGYPELKKYPHFYGHYGTAWQNQIKEFAAFPGAILMTTNCLQKPQQSYHDNIFTTGLVGWPGVRHVANADFTPVIEKALTLPGFADDAPGREVLVGFARNTVLGVAPKVIELVKAGKIRHFFLVGGCDGAKPGRDYYTELVEKIPADCVVLTLACGKFRFFDKDLGAIDGIPRLLDVGQCNDAYSAVKIALALADAFGVGVNELPLSLILSWYEQKAVVILLSLLALGVKNIRLGPTLPAFISPNVLNFLVANYNIKAITTPDADLKAILG
jgi:hydroxylamine reductase